MGALEVGVNPLSQLLPADELARRVEERTSWTCAVSIGDKGGGTGLLVSRNVVLTNYHVILPLLRNPQLARVSSCRFDFVEDPETGDTLEGVRVPFAERWEGPSRPFSPADETGADTGFKPDELDFALIYLAEPIGEAPVARGSYRRSSRGWLPLPSEPPLPRVGAPLFIWQHPAVPESLMTSKLVVMPQKSAQGAVLSVLEAGLRLRHDVTTFHGSSGAACFDANFELVALHHAGDPKLDASKLGKWNQAVPMQAIVAYLKREQHQDLIGVLPPAPVRVLPTALPNERTTQQADMIEKRVRAATILMDRDSDEDGIAWARDKQNGPPGIVHVLACRHIDSHRNFLERLVRLSLAAQDEGIEARQTREQAFLSAATGVVSGEAWQRVSLTWPPAREKPERALQLMRRDLESIAKSPSRTAIDIAIDVAGANLNREKQLVPALAQFCATIASAERLQVFIVYYDRQATPESDATFERRKQLVRMWTPDNRPPGGGVCLHLENINSFDLNGWCRTVLGLWQGDEQSFFEEVETVFSNGKLPMLEAERGVTPILRRNLTGSV